MARIRTIKPEFPQSESMGRLSRDARLLFVNLWTICDDEGRTRGNSRMLASLLFPYDDDAPALIEGWLCSLEEEGCIVRYVVDGSTYLQIRNWLNHQKIDKPSKSKLPAFDESSRILSNARESSSVDLGPRTVDLGIKPPSSFANAQEEPPTANASSKRRPATTFKDWISDLKESGEKAISAYSPVWDYAERTGIPEDWIRMAWVKFRDRYEHDEKAKRKRYADWRRVFLNAIEGNWLRLWAWSERESGYVLTTVGVQADRDTREAA